MTTIINAFEWRPQQIAKQIEIFFFSNATRVYMYTYVLHVTCCNLFDFNYENDLFEFFSLFLFLPFSSSMIHHILIMIMLRRPKKNLFSFTFKIYFPPIINQIF